MDIQPDFKDLLALLNANHVEFLIVGGYALAFHGAPRVTGDIDIGLNEYIVNKKASGRQKDLADIVLI